MTRKNLITFACALLTLCSCTKVEYIEVIVPVDVEKEVPVEPVTYYEYNGKQYSIHSLESKFEDGYYYFLMAREPEQPYSSRIELIVPEFNLGKVLDFTDVMLTKGIDYVLLFEDAEHYYSPAYAPKSGTLQVRKNSAEDSYKVKFDIVLPDGATLKFDYNGKFSPEEAE